MGESPPPKKRFEITRQNNLLVAILLVFFVFFGYLCNSVEKSIGYRIIFLHQALFAPGTFPSVIILVLIIAIMVVREPFWEYGLRNSLWLTPIILGFSWFWFLIINQFNFGEILTNFSNSITLTQFLIEGFLTVIIILGITFFTAVGSIILKMKFIQYKQKHRD